MAKGARHRVDEPGSHQWRPDIDKHPRSLIEGWAAATEAVRGRATAELPCTRPRAGGARSTRCTRTAGVCTTVACKSGQGQCQSGKEFSIESSDIVTRQQGHCFSTNFPWDHACFVRSCGAHGPRRAIAHSGKATPTCYVLDETGRAGTIHTRTSTGVSKVKKRRVKNEHLFRHPGYRFKSLSVASSNACRQLHVHARRKSEAPWKSDERKAHDRGRTATRRLAPRHRTEAPNTTWACGLHD